VTSLLDAVDVEEFAQLAGIDLSPAQATELEEVLYLRSEPHRWRWPEWRMTDGLPGSRHFVVARALIGFLVLGEDVLWSIPHQVTLGSRFRQLVKYVDQIGAPDVKVRRANGDQGFEQRDSGARIRLMHSPKLRGYPCDLLIVEGSAQLTREQREDLLPTMAAKRNPQIIYA
jgi:hypothetical protein